MLRVRSPEYCTTINGTVLAYNFVLWSTMYYVSLLGLRDAINTGLAGSTSTTNSTIIANQVCCESDVFIICLFPWNPKQNVIQTTTGQYRECHGTHLEGGKAILDHLEHRLFGEAFGTLCNVVLEYTLVHCTTTYHNRGEQSGNDQSKQGCPCLFDEFDTVSRKTAAPYSSTLSWTT